MYCKKCGTIRVGGADFCPMCGMELPKLTQPKKNKDGSIDFFVDGEWVTIPEYNAEMFPLMFEIGQNFVSMYNDLDEYLSHWGKYFDSVFENAIPYFTKSLGKMLNYFYNWLCENEVDYISDTDFIDAATDILDIDEDMKIFGDWADAVTEQVNKISAIRAAQRSSRSRWQGGGFGIKGAIKGAIKAGMLNFGTDILRGIGDSHIDKKDAEKIKQLKRETGQIVNPEERLKMLFLKYYLRILQFSLELYVTDYYGEDLNYSDMCYRSRLGMAGTEGLRSDMIFDSETVKTYKKLAREAILLYPFDPRPYVNLIETAGSEPQQIEVLVEYMDINPYFDAMVFLNVKEYLFQLQANFSELSRSQKIDYVQRLGRLSFCSCLHEDAKYIRQMHFKFADKLKSMGLMK